MNQQIKITNLLTLFKGFLYVTCNTTLRNEALLILNTMFNEHEDINYSIMMNIIFTISDAVNDSNLEDIDVYRRIYHERMVYKSALAHA